MFEVKVRDVSHIYQAGAHLLFLRVPQGSAVITTETHNGKNSTTNREHTCRTLSTLVVTLPLLEPLHSWGQNIKYVQVSSICGENKSSIIQVPLDTNGKLVQ